LATQHTGFAEMTGGLSETQIHAELEGLCHQHLLLREPGEKGGSEYSCHPILRDHFRSTLLKRHKSVGVEIANILADQPSTGRAKDIRELQPILAAIELLLDAGDFKRADDLYSGRLRSAGVTLFLTLPAPQEGIKCALGFVADEERRRNCREQLAGWKLGFYLNAVGLFAQVAGEFQFALPFYQDGVSVDRAGKHREGLSIKLQNTAELSTTLGLFEGAEGVANEALDLARSLNDETEKRDSLARLGDLLAALGRSSKAAHYFHEANEIERHPDPHGDELYSLRGIQWADFLIRLGRRSRAKELTEKNLKICLKYGWQDKVVLCHCILGRIAAIEMDYSGSEEHLTDAESILRKGHVIQWLPRVLTAQAELNRLLKRWDKAERYVEEAIHIAAEAIDSGTARKKLDEVKEVSNKV